MYEEKSKSKFNIDWKSLLIKLAILFFILFIVMWIVSLIKNKDKKEVKESNLGTNLQLMEKAALDYFTESTLPENINGRKKITLGEMVDTKLLVEFKDQNNKSCDKTSSYAEATKINTTDYTIKVKLVCGSEADYIINTIKKEVEENITDNINTDNKEEDKNTTNNGTSNSNNNSTTKPNNSTTTTKPSTSTNTKPSDNASTTKPSTSTTTKPTTSVTTCKYGNMEYQETYPLAYVVKGNCALSRTELYQGSYANAASSIGNAEYKKLTNEIAELEKITKTDLYVETPVYNEILNKNNTGYVGYQIIYGVKQKTAYTPKTIYLYYLASDGTRKVVIDNRASLKNNVVTADKIELSETLVTMYENDVHTLKANITPNNTTNKTITWKSNDETIVTVTKDGVIKGIKAGVTTVEASIDNVKATVEVKVLKKESAEVTATYCKKSVKTIYSIGYIDKNVVATTDKYSYKVVLDDATIENYLDVRTRNIYNYSGYLQAFNYFDSKNKDLSLDGESKGGVNPQNAVILSKTSLNAYNFAPTIKKLNNSSSALNFEITIDIKNNNEIKNATPYKVNDKFYVYFVPFAIDILYYNNSDCIQVKESEFSKYENSNYKKIYSGKSY